MQAILRNLDAGSRVVSFMLGGLTLALAFAAIATSSSASEITDWAGRVLGWTFVGLLSALVFICLLSWVRLYRDGTTPQTEVWFEAGVQAANGVTTLALTFTLLGISLGIGSLAGQELTPDTIQAVIRRMTANFSLAFMTTVIGLPVSALLRSLLIVTDARNRNRAFAGEAGRSLYNRKGAP
ncbi:MAG TPA: hypothetical protein VLN73_04100 [Alphaproteobacteria bacterium]|nr:hypothetical protein [Alphaproteobacteria bacterium]